jgi:hypothetical protein
MITRKIVAPHVRCFSGRSDSFILCGSEWHRSTPEDEAHFHTGYDRETHEPSIGIYILRRPNGLVRVGFDLGRIDANLRPAAIERLENRWTQEAASLSKSMFRRVASRAHFSKSFARFEAAPERLEEWKSELASVLSDPASFEPLERRPATDHVNSENNEQP